MNWNWKSISSILCYTALVTIYSNSLGQEMKYAVPHNPRPEMFHYSLEFTENGKVHTGAFYLIILEMVPSQAISHAHWLALWRRL